MPLYRLHPCTSLQRNIPPHLDLLVLVLFRRLLLSMARSVFHAPAYQMLPYIHLAGFLSISQTGLYLRSQCLSQNSTLSYMLHPCTSRQKYTPLLPVSLALSPCPRFLLPAQTAGFRVPAYQTEGSADRIFSARHLHM